MINNLDELEVYQSYDIDYQDEKGVHHLDNVQFFNFKDDGTVVFARNEVKSTDIIKIDYHKDFWERDKIYVKCPSNDLIYSAVITKESNTTFSVLVNGYKEPISITFMKSSLAVRGSNLWGNNWRIITNMSDDEVNSYNQNVKQKNHRNYLISLFCGGFREKRIKWEKMSDQELENIFEIVKPFISKE